MKQVFLFLISLILLPSCATLINRRNCNFKIATNIPIAKVQIQDSIYRLPAKVKVERSKKDLPVKLISDTLIKDYIIKASPNPAFCYGNLIWLHVCPLAYLIDLTNPKRFYYGFSINLNPYDTVTIIRPRPLRGFYNYFLETYLARQGQINLKFSLPEINSFYLQPQNEASKANTGYLGISVGLEYYYKENKFVSLSANGNFDFLEPFPAFVDYSEDHEEMSSLYFGLSDNYKFKRFSFGYGLSYSINRWALRPGKSDPPPSSRAPLTKTNQSIGFLINGYHQFYKQLYLGLIYRPSIINIYPAAEIRYQHLISIELTWKLKLKK